MSENVENIEAAAPEDTADIVTPAEETGGAVTSAAEADGEAPENAEEAAAEAAENAEEAPAVDNKKAGKRKKKDEFAYKKDIWYRGPLSYRHLKLLGWICIVIGQIAIVEELKLKVCGSGNEFFLNDEIISFIAPSALPLLLISVFAFLLKKRDNYKNTLIIYGSLSVGIAGLFVLIYERYILVMADTLLKGDRSDLAQRFDMLLYSTGEYKGFIAFNIFIDIFLCTQIMFFLDYEPKKFFTGKKLLIFRALVVLPVAYEVVCIVLKVMATDNLITLPLWVSPFLTTKPPVSILMFVSIVRYIKLREERFFATGRTREQYETFIGTNINSFRFSKHLVLIILVYVLLDLVLLIVLAAIHSVLLAGMANADSLSGDVIFEAMDTVSAWGFGGTAKMVDLLPIVLLFSYTRNHKQPLFDTAIPIAGVIAIVIVYIDGAFQMLQSLYLKVEEELLSIFGLLTEAGA